MPNLLIRNVPKKTIHFAKRLAREHHHSLQEELRTILLNVLRSQTEEWTGKADVIRDKLSRKKAAHTDTVGLLRRDRDR